MHVRGLPDVPPADDRTEHILRICTAHIGRDLTSEEKLWIMRDLGDSVTDLITRPRRESAE